jgi:hypothetical protein
MPQLRYLEPSYGIQLTDIKENSVVGKEYKVMYLCAQVVHASTSIKRSRYFFDIITSGKTIHCCALTPQDQDDWVIKINQVRDSLINSHLQSAEGIVDEEDDEGKLGIVESRQLLQQLLAEDAGGSFNANRNCADCDDPKPDWASINLGVFICLACSGVHRSLGVHISQVRSVTLDRWRLEDIEAMKLRGNAIVNQEWAQRLQRDADSFRSTFSKCANTSLSLIKPSASA